MSRTKFRELDSTYRMAWCVRFDQSTLKTTVFHGSAVETFKNGFVEGAWSDPYGDRGFADADLFLGSGALNLTSSPLFSTASHPYEPLYSARNDGDLFIANSLPFLCAVGGFSLDLGYPFYLHDISSFTGGLSQATTRIPLDARSELRVHRCSLIEIGPDLRLDEDRRPPLPQVESFSEYRSFLSDVSRAIARNAADSARRRVFSPLATISTGYDSPAAAVFASEAGASRAVTFSSGRAAFGPGSDAGTEVGHHLGLDVSTKSRMDYRDRDDFPEADFLAAGTGGEDVVFASAEKELQGTILFTGFAGDSLWTKHHPTPGQGLDYATGDRSGSSLAEFRLRTGFIHFPVPLTTYTLLPSLHRISNSPEMEPWSVADGQQLSLDALLGRTGPGYDRPIARRIVEGKGVPREHFGQKKRAVSQPFYHDEDLGEIMSERSLEDFRTFLRTADLPPGGFAPLLYRVASTLYWILDLPLKLVRKLSLYLGRPVDVTLPWPRRYRESLSENLYTFHWAVEKVRSRYEEALHRNFEGDDSCD